MKSMDSLNLKTYFVLSEGFNAQFKHVPKGCINLFWKMQIQ